MIYKVLLMGHLIGDFYVQSGKMAAKKKKDMRVLRKHCIYYALSLLLLCSVVITKEEAIPCLLLILSMGILHGILDLAKIRMENRTNHRYDIFLLLFDQCLHITALFGGCYLLGIRGGQYTNLLGKTLALSLVEREVSVLLGILICAKPASLLVKLVLSKISEETERLHREASNLIKAEYNPQTGSVIGVLEREIIFILGIIGQFGTIGFVLAAKSLARFKQLEDQQFAEKYIIGTLLSSFLAIICAVIIRNYFFI